MTLLLKKKDNFNYEDPSKFNSKKIYRNKQRNIMANGW